MPADLPSVRLANALVLFDEFVQATVKHPDAATLRGLEGRFAERLGIQPSYWSQIKSRSRQIGERLARQFEQQCGKPSGWMDVPPHEREAKSHRTSSPEGSPAHSADPASEPGSVPQGDDERFIVGLVLTYYRRHPQRARARLLDLLGEVLGPPAAAQPTPPATRRADVDEHALWTKTSAGVAPLKRKR